MTKSSSSAPKSKSQHLSEDQIEEKRLELEKKHGSTVHCFMFVDAERDEQIIGYMKEPARLLKMRALDMIAQQSVSQSSDVLLRGSLIQEESSPRILSEKPEDDKVYISALMQVQKLFKFYVNALKKN